MSASLARVTISAPHRRVDVALPEHVPLAELLPDLLRHAGEELADDGERHGGWLLRTVDGGVLTPAQGLFPQGVRDGAVLHLVPAGTQWPQLEYDDVVEAIADGARRRGSAWGAPATRTGSLVGCGVLLGVGAVALLLGGPRAGDAPAGLAVAGLLTVVAAAASRAYGAGAVGAALGGYALPYAFVGGAALAASGDRVGPLGPVARVGAPELLAGSAATLLVAVLGAVGVAAGHRVFAAGVTVGLLAALAAAVALVPGVPAGGAAAVLATVLVCGVAALPLLAIRFGKVPVPPVTLPPAGDGERDLPDREAVFAAVARTEELLSGMLTGYALLAAGAFAVLVAAGGGWGRLLAAVAATALLLRSRLFVTVRQRVPLVAAGLAGVVADALGLFPARPWVVLAVLVAAALATVLAGAAYSRRPPSPYLARAADLLDTLTVVAVVPVTCAVLGLYGQLAALVG
jgi:type VII secretion integral membrane protein EccD